MLLVLILIKESFLKTRGFHSFNSFYVEIKKEMARRKYLRRLSLSFSHLTFPNFDCFFLSLFKLSIYIDRHTHEYI